MTSGDLSKILTASAVLLDFDGPVCAVFAGISDYEVATRIRVALGAHGVQLPPAVEAENDPLEVMRFAAELRTDILEAADDAFRAGELAAVAYARATPFAVDFMKAVRTADKKLAIVSNNSAEAIHAYLEMSGGRGYVSAVEGRPYAAPQLMKPHRYIVDRALNALGAQPSEAVLIGDSVSDIQAARTVGVRSIGFANRKEKVPLLSAAGADAIVAGPNGMGALVDALL
jgi:HAD superfamily hydrolase (TIGR01509 family)